MHDESTRLCACGCGQPVSKPTNRYVQTHNRGTSRRPYPRRNRSQPADRDAAAARFWKRTERDGACLLWTGGGDGKGYGRVNFQGRFYRAHQLAWVLRHGPIPDGLCVLHTCDVRRCLEDGHHFLGTRADNIRDMEAKGRDRRATPGVAHPGAKLTDAVVIEIRRRRAEGASYHDMAAAFGVNWTTISRVARRVAWKHVS